MNYTTYSTERLLFLRREKEKELGSIKSELEMRGEFWWRK